MQKKSINNLQMPYKDTQKQREAWRKAQTRKQGMTKGMTSLSIDIIPSDIGCDKDITKEAYSPSMASLLNRLKDPVYSAKLRAIRDGLKAKNQLDEVMIGVDGLTFRAVDILKEVMSS